MLRLLFSFTLLVFFTGCSTRIITPIQESPPQIEAEVIQEIPQESNDDQWIKNALYEEYQKWQTTPYKLGGLGGEGEKGVDCSSLIQQIYKNAFGIALPRTTISQVEKGRVINKEDTKVGDLVFFKTGYNKRHAGIIIEEGKFIHSSQKYGVIISQLSNPYWKNSYWQSRRILPE